MTVPDGSSFALCLTHDVDRPYKSLPQALYYAIRERRLHHLRTVVSDDNPYWQFESIMALEDEFDVRSAFYFLNEPHLLVERGPRAWVRPTNWVQHLGRYDVHREELADVIRRLDEGGWEVGLHGSFSAATDRQRLAREKERVESVLGHEVAGVRQHYFRLDVPDTWRHHVAVGLQYDASLGSSVENGFDFGYEPIRPFDGEFVVFPLTLMEQTLPDPDKHFDRSWSMVSELMTEAEENDAVMTVLWHPRFFNETEFPGYKRLYRRLLERAVELDAWIGPPIDLYEHLECGQHADSAVPDLQ